MGRLVIILVALLAIAPAHAQSPNLNGWWRATLERHGDRIDFYLGMSESEGQPAVQISVPAVRTHGLNVGPYEIQGDTLSVPGLGWQLAIVDEGAALTGTVPRGLAPHHDIAARFVRVEEPPTLPPLTGAEQAPSPAWIIEIGAPVWGGLTYDAARERLYIGADNGRLIAVDARNGALVWMVDLGAPIRAAPTLANNRLYATTDRALYSVNVRDAAIDWSRTFGAERARRLPISDPDARWDHYGAAAVISGEAVITASRDGCAYAFRSRNGGELWRRCVDDILTGTPAVAGDRVLIGGFDGHAYALSRSDGVELWRHDLHAPIPRGPAIADDIAAFGSRTYDLSALDTGSGVERWRRHFWFSWVDSEPVLRDGTIYVGSSDMLAVQALSPRGEQHWVASLPGWAWPAPAVSANSVYAAAVGARSYFSPRQGGFAAFNRATGALRWVIFSGPREEAEMYGFAAAPVVAGTRVFAADLNGRIYAFDDPGA